jgi:hypothetical protein
VSAVRPITPALIAIAALLSVTVVARTADASEQGEPPKNTERYGRLHNEEDVSQLTDGSAPCGATQTDLSGRVNDIPSTTLTGEPAAPRAGPRRRPFVAMLMAVPLVTYAGATGPRPSEVLTPADRFATSQLIGVGYVVNPQFRFGVMGIFNEALTGLPPAADAWQFGGIAPVAIGTFQHFIIGGGPIVGYRSGGKLQTDVGAVVLAGASIPIARGLALNLAAPVTALFARRVTVSVGVAVGVSKVF